MEHLSKFAVLAGVAAALSLPQAVSAVPVSQFADEVYVMSNASAANHVAVLKRTDNGALRLQGTYATGGRGSGVGELVPPNPLGSQNGLLLSADRNWLFAVNAGSNEVSVFRNDEGQLELTSTVGSGGSYPVSIAVRDDLVYVLNAGGEVTVAAFRLSASGQLVPLPDSVRSLNTTTPYVGQQPHVLLSPAQVEFTPDGQWLVVVEKESSGGSLMLFGVEPDGRLAPSPVVTPSPDPAPFGFAFDQAGRLLITEGLNGAASSYGLNGDGTLTPLSLTVRTGQNATCWIDTAGSFAYASNTASGTLSSYRIGRDGSLELLEGVADTTGLGPIDLAVSSDSRYLDVIVSGTGNVRTYRIKPYTGKLQLLSETPVFGPLTGAAGLASE